MTLKPRSDNPPRPAPWLICIAVVAVTVTILAPHIWLVLLSEGLYALLLLAGAAGWGAWPTAWLGFGRRRAIQQACLAIGLGLGILALLTLALGVSGLLNRPIAWALLGAGGALGLLRVYLAQSAATRPTGDQLTSLQIVLRTLALLTLVPAVSIALFGASLPPGILWPAEAGGYDALEYHLQCPREYYEAGQIQFLPHNVYASFPQQMEMLYLLLMHLTDDLNQAAVAAQLLHASCGLIAIIVIAAWQPRGWPALTAAIAAGGVAWLAYLGCLAYVELGMLLFAALAAAVLIDHLESGGSAGWRSALAAGIFAGLAGGCKYTALALIAAPLGIAWAIAMRGSPAARIRALAVYALAVAAAFSPWLIRNAAFTGNPVFPFAYASFERWMPPDVWSPEQAAQWEQGHRFKAEGRPLAARVRTAWSELFASSMFGPGLFLAALAGAVGRRSRLTLMMLIWSAAMFAVWLFATHMPGRFIVPLIVPLAWLAGDVWRLAPRAIPVGVTTLVALWTLLGGSTVLAGDMRSRAARMGGSLSAWIGMTDVMSEQHYVNRATPPDANVKLIGDAAVFYVRRSFEYTVVFNRDPWIQYAAGHVSPADCVDWLRRRGVTHVLFFWPEIERLRGTYGFSDVVTHEWVSRLAEAGLTPVSGSGLPDGFLYQVTGP